MKTQRGYFHHARQQSHALSAAAVPAGTQVPWPRRCASLSEEPVFSAGACGESRAGTGTSCSVHGQHCDRDKVPSTKPVTLSSLASAILIALLGALLPHRVISGHGRGWPKSTGLLSAAECQLLHTDPELWTWWDSAFQHLLLKVEIMGITRQAGPSSQSVRALTVLLNPCGI